MSAIKLNSSGGGSITISPASTASTLTLTAPAQTGTIGLDGPAFRAYASSATNIATSTPTKLVYATEAFDTNSNYDTSTSRFTPTVAGIYLISANHYVIGAETAGYMQMAIYKNGTAIAYSTVSTAAGIYINEVQTIIDANGSTDYFEAYVNQSTGVTRNTGTGQWYSFSAAMVRAA